MFWLGYMKLKDTRLKKKKKSNTDDCALPPRNNLFRGWLRKGERKFLPSCFVENYPDANGQYAFHTEGEKDREK